MSDDFADQEHDGAIAALHHAVRPEEWVHRSGTGAAARGRWRRMRRARYATTVGTAAAVTGVAVLVASTFGGGGASEASPEGGATHHTSAAPAKTAIPKSPATSAAAKQTMASYYDKWKTCPSGELTVAPSQPGATVPPTSTKVWIDACDRMMVTLSALNTGADVSPAPSSWYLPDAHTLPPSTLGRDDPAPAKAVPHMGPSVYRIEDSRGTVVLSFHSSAAHESDPPAGSTSVTMFDGLRAWFAPPKPNAYGKAAGGEFYVENAKGQDAYALLLSSPSAYTTEEFKALVTNPAFEHMMAANLAEPDF